MMYPVEYNIYGVGSSPVESFEKDDWGNGDDHTSTSLSAGGVRKYNSTAGRFMSVDPLWEKYLGWSPYQYSGNNPVNAVDVDGRDAVAVQNGCQLTITAVYQVSSYSSSEISNMNTSINGFLNSQNYTVTEGEYQGYSVNFDLKFVSADSPDAYKLTEIQGIDIRNEFTSLPEGSYNKITDGVEIDFRNIPLGNGKFKTNGGTVLDHKYLFMNRGYDNLRNRIHEIFHTLFYDNDKADSGIGNYVPGNDMPNQQDINNLFIISPLPVVQGEEND